MRVIPQFLIAAPNSGSGKTTICRGLMALLVKKGYKVQPFKCGPDYIDTKYHEVVCGRSSVNLDLFMSSAAHVAQIYAFHSAGADACIIEGMMGMFDGYERDAGSSASIAITLNLPVILVVDAQSTAYSVAPLLSGFVNFRPEVKVEGVIFNRVGSLRHYEMLKEACADLGVKCFGYLPKDGMLKLNSRYLGLDFSSSTGTDTIGHLVDLLERHVDWRQLLDAVTLPLSDILLETFAKGEMHCLVARNNESFSFIYTAHIEILERLGKVSFFDPEMDCRIPSEVDLLYLPGGYPEKHLKELSAARQTLASIREYAETGGRVLAECGGMIYLSRGVLTGCKENNNEKAYKLAGVLPFHITDKEKDRKLSLGYRQLIYNGQLLRGHEFHYTQILDLPDKEIGCLHSVAQVKDAKKCPVPTPVFRYKNVIASYTHLYWGETDLMHLFD